MFYQTGKRFQLMAPILGRNLPDMKGNRYCINIVSVAGMPSSGLAMEARICS